MPTIVLAANAANNDFIESSNATYATARSGGTVVVGGINTVNAFGQFVNAGTYAVRQALLEFDFYAPLIALGYTAAQILASTISSAILNTNFSAAPDSTFQANARLYNYGATITTADYVPGASISGNTLLAHISATSTISGARDWTDDAFAANVSKTSTPTRIGLFGKNTEDNTTPTDYQRANIKGAGDATLYPILTVTYTLASSAGMMMVSD